MLYSKPNEAYMTTPTEQDQIDGLNYTIRVRKQGNRYHAEWDNAGTLSGIYHGEGIGPREAMIRLIEMSPLPSHDQA
jgi:hypothetical protein